MAILLPLLLALPSSALAAIGVALGFSVIMTALFYMVAYALQSPQLIALSKEELSALVFSVFIILFWFSLDGVLNTVTNGLLASSVSGRVSLPEGSEYGLTTTHIDLAYASLNVLFLKLRNLYVNLYLFEVLIGFLSTVSFPIGSPVAAVNIVSFSFTPFTGLALLSNAHTTVVEAIGYAMTLVWAKEFILIFSRDVIPIILLPLGLVMRAFPFFRTTGSSIIAFCIACYFVLPLAVLLSNYMIFDLYEPAEFSYSPESSIFSGRSSSDRNEHVSAEDVESSIHEGREGEHAEELLNLFSAPTAGEEAVTAGGPCSGGAFSRVICGFWNVGRSGIRIGREMISTVWSMGSFMMGMTGDFFMTAFNNPLMPSSMATGLYFFILTEVATMSQFLVLVTVTSVVELILTITMYRNIALIIGGELEIAGLTKIL